MSVSVTQLNIDVKIAGADEAAGKLKKVEQAADSVGKKAGGATGLFARFEDGVKSLDDAVDKVEKPMRTFSGAIDIASVALGAGLAGPIGQVVNQLKELGVELYKSIYVTLEYEKATKTLAERKKELIQKELEYADVLEQQNAQRRSFVSQSLAALATNVPDADAALIDRVKGAASAVEGSRIQLKLLQDELAKNSIRTEDYKLKVGALARAITEGQKELKGLGAATDSVGESTDKTTEKTKKLTDAQKAALQAAKELAEQLALPPPEFIQSLSTRPFENAVPIAKALGDIIQGGYLDLDKLQADAEEGVAKVSDGLIQSMGDNPLLASLMEDSVAVFSELDPKPASALAQSMKSMGDAAADLGSFGVQAMQSFSQAAGQALASLVIDGEKATGSFKKLAGQVAAGLSAQAFGYAVFLTALGTAAALVPGLQLEAPKIFTGAAVMAGTGLLLGITARALGASTYGPGSAGQSTSSAGAAAQDRVSSFSAGGAGAQPMQVTVVLGVDEVSNVLVRQSQREARSGSLSASRLAVA